MPELVFWYRPADWPSDARTDFAQCADEVKQRGGWVAVTPRMGDNRETLIIALPVDAHPFGLGFPVTNMLQR